MRKILLCSPFFEGKKFTTCGITKWTRNIMSRQVQNDSFIVEILPFDRTVDLDEESPFWERLYSGIKDYLRLVLKTKRKLSSNHYDIVQVSTSAGLGLIRDYLIARIAIQNGTKPIYHFHFGRIPDLYKQNNWETRLLKKVIKLAYAVIVMDKISYEVLSAQGCNVFYLPNPLSKEIFQYIRTVEGIVERIPNQFLFVGHVVSSKGIFELVEACSKISNINLRVVGKVFEETKKELMKIAKARDDGMWLLFIGEIPHEEVLHEMCMCDIFVLPTHTEGFPNVILESMACSCPIITTSVGAIPEMLNIDKDPCGAVIDPKNIDAIRRAILSLRCNTDLKNTFGVKAKSRVEENYTVDVVWKQLESIWLNT